MMNPQMMKMAMDQMNRMTPQQMAALQTQMGSISPEMMQQQMNFFNSMSPEQQAEVQRQASNVSPEQIAAGAGAFQQQAAGQQGYRLQSANNLKAQGNTLHKQGSYKAASEKYEQALSAVAGHTGQDADELTKACRLNLSLCYLNMGRFTACASSCSEVLQIEPANRKALYRRGQAHLGSGNYPAAVKDLKAAVKLAPADERAIIQEKLNTAQEKAGSRIDDIESSDDDIETVQTDVTSAALPRDQPTRIEEISEPSSRSASTIGQSNGFPSAGGGFPPGMARPSAQQMKDMAAQLKANPAMAEAVFNVSPEQMEMMARMSGVSLPPGMTPDMMKQASSMLSSMSPDELDQMAAQAGSAGFPAAPSPPAAATEPANRGQDTSAAAAQVAASSPEAAVTSAAAAMPSGAGPPGMSMAGGGLEQAASMMQANPGMMKTALEMMQKMPPEQLAAMQQQAMSGGMGRPGGAGTPSPDQMKSMESMLNNPEMLQSMQEMLGSMSADDLSSMSKQAGFNISPEQAEQMTKQLKKLTPKQMAMLMGTARFFQQAKDFVMARKMLVISVLVLLFALFLRWLGYI